MKIQLTERAQADLLSLEGISGRRFSTRYFIPF
jgi:hypothetical protein